MPCYKTTVEYVIKVEKIIEADDKHEAWAIAYYAARDEFLKEPSRMIKEYPVRVGKVESEEV